MNRLVILFVIVLVTLFSSCKKEDNNTSPVISTHGKLTIKIQNEVDGQPITFGTIKYRNAAGNNYSVEALKYYVSNIYLIKENGDTLKFKNNELINAADTTTCQFALDSVANGNFKAIRFHIGVDPDSNHTGLQLGDLDPSYGMIWEWRTGYTFFKHEGKFIDSTGATESLIYHLGTDIAHTTIDLPVTAFEMKGTSKTMYLKFNLNNVYKAPTSINFNNNNNRQSLTVDDKPWIYWIKGNFPNCFTIDKVN